MPIQILACWRRGLLLRPKCLHLLPPPHSPQVPGEGLAPVPVKDLALLGDFVGVAVGLDLHCNLGDGHFVFLLPETKILNPVKLCKKYLNYFPCIPQRLLLELEETWTDSLECFLHLFPFAQRFLAVL